MLQSMISKWADIVVEKRWIVLILTVLTLGASVLPMKNLYFDNSSELFFIEGDPNLVNYNNLLDRFGDDEFLLIGIESKASQKNVFNQEILEMVAEMTEFLEEHEYITKVSSLTKYQYMIAEDDSLETIDLIEDIEEFEYTEEALNGMANIMKDEDLAINVLLSPDLRHTRIVANTLYQKGESAHKTQLVNDLNAFLAEKDYASKGYDLKLFGNAIIAERFATVTQEDSSWINPTMAVLMMVILFISFRTVTSMFLPWLVIACSLVVVIGFQGFMHWPFNTVNTALPPIIIIMGIGDAVHILTEFYHFRNDGLDPKASAKKAVEAMWLPCFYTSLTTAIGFFALSVTKLVPIRELGVLGGLGALMAFFLSVTVLPALLSFLTRIPAATKRIVSNGWVTRLTHFLTKYTYTHRKVLTIACVALFVVSASLASQVTVDSNFVNYFKSKEKIRHDILYFDEIYKGGSNIDVMIDSGVEGGAKDPELLRDVQKLQEYIETLDGTGKAVSLVDFVSEMNMSMHNDDPAYKVIPDSRELVAQYLLLYENSSPEEDLTDMKSFDERHLHISVSLQNRSANETKILLDTIKNEIATNYAHRDMILSGGMVLFNAQDTYTSEGMVESFGLAIILIGLCFFVLFRSFKYGFLALIPSILPIIFAGGVLYLLGITMNLGTMIVGAMTIGIAVDDSIHVMNRYLQAIRNGKSVHTAVELALTESGRAVIFTSIILISGFSLNLFGTFIPFIYTGLFSAIIMSLALICDLLLLPAILYNLDGKINAEANNSQLKKAVA